MEKRSSKNSKCYDVAAVFQAAQDDKSLHVHLISKLAHIFDNINKKLFTTSYIFCLKKIFIDSQDTQSSCTSIALDFAVKFLIHLIETDARKNENPSEDVIQFWTNVFDFFREKHGVPDTRIRRRICQFVGRFMQLMNQEGELDCKICEMIVEIMKERIKDRLPIVRVQAILAVYRLQDESDVHCPVTEMLLNCIETDTAADVRKLAVSKISLRNKTTVRTLIDRVDDVSEKVRKGVFLTFKKLHPLHFSAEERRRLFYTGFYNNNESVRSVVKDQLLPAWFQRTDCDHIKFLRMFDLIFESPVLMTKILMPLIETPHEEKSRKMINILLDETHAIPLEKLTCENTFFWRCYVFNVSGMVNEKRDYEWQPGKSYDAHAVGLLPDLSVFCDYINAFYKSMNKGNENDEKWIRKEQEFIFTQLIELCKTYDYADEVGRKNLQLLCLNLLQDVEIKTLKPVIQLYFNLRTNLSESICNITSVVNNLLYPNNLETTTSERAEQQEITKNSDMMQGVNVTPELEKSIKFKVAKLEVRLEELNDLLENAIKVQDFTRAESLKNDVSSVREQVGLLKDNLYCKPQSVCYTSSEEIEDSTMECEFQKTNPLENLDLSTILKCITILQEMLNLSCIKSLTPELRALLQDFVLFACESDDHIVAPLATELLGSFCLRDKNLAKDHFVTIFSLCGNSDVCVSALRVIFDFLACFGADTFNITNLDDAENDTKTRRESSCSISDTSSDDESEGEDDKISGYAFISTLINLLDEEYLEARYIVVHGLCRLMAVGKLKSAKVLSRLIIMWFHPSSRESGEIRSCLNFFFPFFVRCKWSLSIFEEAFIPTMDILFEAPSHNPISDISQKDVLRVLCDITNPTYVCQENEVNDNIHYNLAVLICKSIIERDSFNHIVILLKGLDYLNLANIPDSTLSTINNLLEKMMKKFKKKRFTKLVCDTQKFKTKLNTAVAKQSDTLLSDVQT